MYSIDCRTYEDLVAGHVDGVLSDDERTAADQHLERCRRCSQLRRDVEGARDLVRGRAPRHASPQALRDRVADALEQESRSQPVELASRRHARWATRVALVGALAAAVVLALSSLLRPPSPDLLVLLGQDVRAAEAQAIPLAVQTTHVQELRRFFRASGRFDFAHTADDLGHLGVQPVGGDIVNVAGVSMARAVYQGPGCKVVCRHFRAGLLRLPGGGREIGGSRVFTIDGITVRIHDDGKVICCMASDMPPEEFLRDLLGQARARPVVGVAPKG